MNATLHLRAARKGLRASLIGAEVRSKPEWLFLFGDTKRSDSITSLLRGIAKAGEPNNFLPMSPASLHMDPTVYATLRRKQRRLARENPGVLMAVARGANQAIAECQHQFRNRRWNCSTKNFLRGKNLFGKIVDRGEHQLSFLLAPGFSFLSPF